MENNTYYVYDENNQVVNMEAIITGNRIVKAPFECPTEPYQTIYEITITDNDRNNTFTKEITRDCTSFKYKGSIYHL